MPIDVKLPFFNKGEVSPKMYGRVDTVAYQSGLKTALNMIVDVAGGVFNRPGLQYICPVKFYDKAVRLVPFTFNTTDTHMLEFGHNYMRVIREDFQQLTLNPHNITGVVNANPVIIGCPGHGYTTNQEIKFSGTGVSQLDDQVFLVYAPDSTAFQLKSKFTHNIVDASAFDVWVGGGQVDSIYEITTPYASTDLATVDFAQSADILFMTHPLYAPMELRRLALNNWQLIESNFNSVQPYPTQIQASENTGSPGSTVCQYQVTAIVGSANTGIESLPGLPPTSYVITGATQASPIVLTIEESSVFSNGDPLYINLVTGMTQLNNRRFLAQNVTDTTLELWDINGNPVDGSNYTLFVDDGMAQIWPTYQTVPNSNDTAVNNVVSWANVTGASRYDIYKLKDGLYGFIGETGETTFTDNNFDPDTTQTPPQEQDLFLNAGDWPAAVGFYQQRKFLGGSLNLPQTWFASQPGDYNNYTGSTPTQDDDYIEATLASGQVNQIKHFLPFQSQIAILTTGQEWAINSGDNTAFTPFTADATAGTNWGTSEHRPFSLGNQIVFVTQDNRTVRTFIYDFFTNNYKSQDLSLTSEHLFRYYEVQDWALARTPYSSMVLTRTDGDAAMLVYNPDENVTGWTHWDTQGYFESVGVVRVCLELNTPLPDDGIYFTVNRQVAIPNDPTIYAVKYIERLHDRRYQDVRDSFFVDAGVSYDLPLEITNILPATIVGLPANVLLVTCPEHGLSVEEVVDFANIEWAEITDSLGNVSQPAQLNDTKYIVSYVQDADNFCIRPLAVGDVSNSITSASFPGYRPYARNGAARLNVFKVNGLDHLNGLFVSCLADGFPIRGLVVTNGTITLPGLASRIHVGLSMRSDVQTLPIDPIPGVQTVSGQLKRLNKIRYRVWDSREMLVGPTFTSLVQTKPTPYVTPSSELYTGDREIIVPGQWSSDGSICFRMLDPLPWSILAVFPDFTLK